MSDDDVRAFIAAGSARQPQRFVLGVGETVDEANASGAWLASDTTAEVRP